ncbi:STM4504/CBY_0614 family protein [Pseudomonas huanghezhanensis]|uniref:STM4504/CBY_0614 family protein n=1 Tax=Pseudomonas huanghezhanensis TaxID=3002903 RepID=UPI0022858D46|nr:hypothetical protein [Pseudomonas sp. BSw22131]
MTIFDLYSKRQERARNGVSDVYSYDEFSPQFRVQLSMMIDELLGSREDARVLAGPSKVYTGMVSILKKEYGVTSLSERVRHDVPHAEFHSFLQYEPNVERCLDAVETAYKMGNRFARKEQYSNGYRQDASESVDACIEELNARFKEAGYGYEFVSDEIFRVDSEFLHVEAIRPAIHFMNFEGFEGARNEFFGAYEHYRHGMHKEALVDAAKSLESTMKIICTLNEWSYTPRDTANKLIQILIENGFIPALHQAHLSGIQTVLTSGIPTLRNNLAGHGDGGEVVEVSAEVVAYGLHLTAAAIVLLGGLQEKRSGAL